MQDEPPLERSSARGTQFEQLNSLSGILLREARVTYNSRAIAATIVGAAVGGMAGYLFFTESGRAVRRQLEPAIDDIARELSSFKHTVGKAATVVSESWKLLNEALGEDGRPPHRHRPRSTAQHRGDAAISSTAPLFRRI